MCITGNLLTRLVIITSLTEALLQRMLRAGNECCHSEFADIHDGEKP